MRAVETEVLLVKTSTASILEWLTHQNLRVIAISDRDIDPAHFQSFLEDKGLIAHAGRIYVYPECNAAIPRKQFFESLLQQEGLHPHEVIHIDSDQRFNQRPLTELGITTVLFDDAADNRQMQTAHWYHQLAQKNAFWRGRHLLQLIRPAAARSFHYNYGYEILGPIYATFILGVIEAVKKHHIKQVFFLAREGELFMKLFNMLCPDCFEPDQIPSAHYLFDPVDRLLLRQHIAD